MDAYETILRDVLTARPLAEVLARVTPSGMKLPDLDFEREQAASCAWLRRLLRDEPPPSGLAGLWFGLYHPALRGGGYTTDLYLCGAETFVLDAIDVDWASGPSYFPAQRYARSQALAALHSAGEEAGVDPQDVCVAYAACLTGRMLYGVGHLLPEGLGVAVGWDSGTALYLGFMRGGALELRDPDEAVTTLRDGLADVEAWLDQPRAPLPDEPSPEALRAWGRKTRAAKAAFFAARAAARRPRTP